MRALTLKMNYNQNTSIKSIALIMGLLLEVTSFMSLQQVTHLSPLWDLLVLWRILEVEGTVNLVLFISTVVLERVPYS